MALFGALATLLTSCLSWQPTEVRRTDEGVHLRVHQRTWSGDAALRLAHLSDLHLGDTTPDGRVSSAFDLVSELRPDVLCLTGDYVNRGLSRVPQLVQLVQRVRRASLGQHGGDPMPIIAVLGNHDHGAGSPEVRAALEGAGVIVLQNESVELRVGRITVTFVGVDDAHSGHDDVARAFEGANTDRPIIALTHRPDIAAAIAERGASIILAGHTHGGQVSVPLLSPIVARLAGLRFLWGWYRVGHAALHVTAGLGTASVPWRAGATGVPEVSLIELVPAGTVRVGGPATRIH